MALTRGQARRLREARVKHLLELPNDILFRIYLHVGSLDTAWALMCTSRKLRAAFHVDPVKVVDTILTNSMPDPLLGLVQAVWDLQSGARSRRMTLRLMRYIDQAHCTSSFNTHAAVSAEFVRGFISLARKIHAMAHCILEHCLTNLNNIQEKLCPFPTLYPEIERLCSWKSGRWRRVESAKYLAPPSWSEKLRMMQGLWLCVFHSSLVQAQQEGDAWICAELAQLERDSDLRVEHFFGNGWAGTFWTIDHGLAVMHLPPQDMDAPYNEAVVLPATMPLPTLPRGTLARAAAQSYLESFKHPPAGLEELAWDEMDPETEGYWFLIGDDVGVAPVVSALHRLPACEYAHLGVLHWSWDRMHALGLTYRGDHRIYAIWHGRVYNYWLSLLPQWLIKRWESIQARDKAEQRITRGAGRDGSGLTYI
ncbi:hypothetical protein MY5147_001835 [Beauveria neobassiana]